MNALQSWLYKATPQQRRELAEKAGTTTASLHQASKAYRTKGVLRITPDLAARLEKASLSIAITPSLRREDLSPACSACDLAAKCRGQHSQD